MNDPLSQKAVAALYVSGQGDWGEPGYLGFKVQVHGQQYGVVLTQDAIRQLGLVIDIPRRAQNQRRFVDLEPLVEGTPPVWLGPLEEGP